MLHLGGQNGITTVDYSVNEPSVDTTEHGSDTTTDTMDINPDNLNGQTTHKSTTMTNEMISEIIAIDTTVLPHIETTDANKQDEVTTSDETSTVKRLPVTTESNSIPTDKIPDGIIPGRTTESSSYEETTTFGEEQVLPIEDDKKTNPNKVNWLHVSIAAAIGAVIVIIIAVPIFLCQRKKLLR